MADRILLMSDDIGEMADRIVHTEKMMLATVSNNNISSIITVPTEGTWISSTNPINITLSNTMTDYILYISNNADMSASTNALVQNNNTYNAWSRVTDFATGNKIYIAVKSVDENVSSVFSNTVMLNLQ